jgi:HSP20 family molecular chaperone IbpA
MSGHNPFDKLTGLAALSEISRRLGSIGEQVKDAVSQAQAAGAQGAEQRFTINTAKGPVEGVSQMSFKVGSLSDRMPASRPTRGGMAARTERSRTAAPDIDGAREPMVDCFDEGETLVVTAELPGVLAGEVTLSVQDGELLVETTGQRRYRARQHFAVPVDAASLTHELRNGILEARIRKVAV